MSESKTSNRRLYVPGSPSGFSLSQLSNSANFKVIIVSAVCFLYSNCPYLTTRASFRAGIVLASWQRLCEAYECMNVCSSTCSPLLHSDMFDMSLAILPSQLTPESIIIISSVICRERCYSNTSWQVERTIVLLSRKFAELRERVSGGGKPI